jgi:hypothetical protein
MQYTVLKFSMMVSANVYTSILSHSREVPQTSYIGFQKEEETPKDQASMKTGSPISITDCDQTDAILWDD